MKIPRPKCSKCGWYEIEEGTCFEPCESIEGYVLDLETHCKKLPAVAEAAKLFAESNWRSGSYAAKLLQALEALEAD